MLPTHPSPRCGLKDPNGTVTQNNFCFCDDPLDQPGITYMYHMLISNNVWANPWPGPWQWTVDNSSRSTLLDPVNPSFMRLKTMIEEAVRNGTCTCKRFAIDTFSNPLRGLSPRIMF